MMGAIGRFDTQRALDLFADWTDRVAKGELPKSDPPRPAGIERNIVVTEWDWNTPKAYLHDEIATDRNNPSVNAHGIIYGSTEASSDFIPGRSVDSKSGLLKTEYRDPKTPSTKSDRSMANRPIGERAHLGQPCNVHNPMYDTQGRLWLTAGSSASQPPRSAKPVQTIRPQCSRKEGLTQRRFTIRRLTSSPPSISASAPIICNSTDKDAVVQLGRQQQ
jgi:hypothetical protein